MVVPLAQQFFSSILYLKHLTSLTHPMLNNPTPQPALVALAALLFYIVKANNHTLPTQLAMRFLCLGHFITSEYFLHTWGKSQTFAKCGPCRWILK